VLLDELRSDVAGGSGPAFGGLVERIDDGQTIGVGSSEGIPLFAKDWSKQERRKERNETMGERTKGEAGGLDSASELNSL
jgi:hypothetical protein